MSATSRFQNAFNEYAGELDNYKQQAYELKELAQTSPEELPAQIAQSLGEPLAAHLLTIYGPKAAGAAKKWIGDKLNSAANEARGQLQDAQNRVQNVVDEARGRVQGAAEDLQARAQGAINDLQGRAQGALNQVQEAANNVQQQSQRVADVARQNAEQVQAPRSTDGAVTEDQPFEQTTRIATTENPPAPDTAIPNGAADAAEGQTDGPGGFIGQLRGLFSPRNTTPREAQAEPDQAPELNNPFRSGTDYDSWTPAQQEDYQDIINGRVTGAQNLTDEQFAQATADRNMLVQRGIARALPGEEGPTAQAASTVQDGDAIYSQGASQAFMRARQAPIEAGEAEPEIDPEVAAMQTSLQQQGTAATAQSFGEAPTRSLADEFQQIPEINLTGDAAAGGTSTTSVAAGSTGTAAEGVTAGANAAVEAGEAVGTGVAGGVDAAATAAGAAGGAAAGAAGGAVTAGEAIAEGGGFDPAGLVVGGLVALGGILADIFSHHHASIPAVPNVPVAAFTSGLPSD